MVRSWTFRNTMENLQLTATCMMRGVIETNNYQIKNTVKWKTKT